MRPISNVRRRFGERRPVRVTFAPDENQESTYSIRGHANDLVTDDGAEEEKASQEQVLF